MPNVDLSQGFLCPICHQKFSDHMELAEHYTNVHKEQSLAVSQTGDTVNAQGLVGDYDLCKQQLIASEQTRMICKCRQRRVSRARHDVLPVTAEIKQQTLQISDLQDELDSLKKRLHTAPAPLVDLVAIR